MWPVLAKRRSKKTKRIFCCNKLNRRPIADKDIVLEKSALSVNSTGLQDNADFFSRGIGFGAGERKLYAAPVIPLLRVDGRTPPTRYFLQISRKVF